jgi:predicted Zn-dependent protease
MSSSRTQPRPLHDRPRRRRPHLRATVAAVLALAPGFSQVAHAQDVAPSLILDTEIDETLHQESDPIFIAAGLDPKAMKIHIVGDKTLNAFTAGGLEIYVNTGFIVLTKTPGELQGVIAHETGHVAGGHIARSGEGESSAMRTFILTMGLGILAALAGAPDAGGALAMSSGYFATLNMLGYTRIQESQADQAAATYLDRAHISGKGLVDFFDNLRYEEVFSYARRYPYFQSHPITSERIEALRVRVSKLADYNKPDSPEALERHRIMVAKMKAFMNSPAQTLSDYKETDTSFEAKYARAIAYYKATQTDRALKAIDDLITEHPADPYLYELKGQVLFESGKPKDADAPYRKAVELKPDAPLLRVLLAQTLMAEEDPKLVDEAIANARRALAADNTNAFGWRLLSQGYDAKGMDGMARLAAAEEKFAVGDQAQAHAFAMRARERLDKNTPEYRRATDIALTSDAGKANQDALSKGGHLN